MTIYWLFEVVEDNVVGKVGVFTHVRESVVLDSFAGAELKWCYDMIENELHDKYKHVVFSKHFTKKQIQKMVSEFKEDHVDKILQDLLGVVVLSDQTKGFDPLNEEDTFILATGDGFAPSHCQRNSRVIDIF